ncbi:MAG: hypothetical protein APF77_05375 [Clostridia bacterium BRH_c25]|nr:MAG: hypothetical protein APF77_05375 [Clostridia bacterium BRH_c25]
MNDNKTIKKLPVLLLIPLSAALAQISSKRPDLVEKLYSSRIYKPIGRILSRATGIFPFSVAELIVLLVPAAFILYTIKVLAKSFSRSRINFMPMAKYITNILVIVSIALFCFLGIWGLNYYRMPFASIAGLDVQPTSVKELESLCRALIERANSLRLSVSIDAEGNMDIPGSRRDILNSCYKGYEVIAHTYPELAGSYGNPKPILLSGLMNYTGICGIYFPFTGEANVNVAIPESSLPSTASHEMAHQRGFSREDEANYISYLACTAHPDVNFKYSGVLLALTNSMNALYKNDRSIHAELSEKYSEGVRHDLAEVNEFWQQYEGPVERTSNRINNAYLKANNQKDGVQSYGRMVDLLIAEHRQASE